MTDWRRGAEGQAEVGSASEALEELPKKARPGRKDCENQKPRVRYRGDGYSNGNRHELGQGVAGRGYLVLTMTDAGGGGRTGRSLKRWEWEWEGGRGPANLGWSMEGHDGTREMDQGNA